MEQKRIKRSVIRKIISAACALSAAVSLCAQSTQAMFSSSYMDTGTAEININTIEDTQKISPYIYGINIESGLSGVSANALKQSDIKVSSYNWESNYSNSGSGNGSENTLSLVGSYPQDRVSSPALYTESLISGARRYGIHSKYVTLQMMGKVAPDSPDKPWETVYFNKTDGYLSSPDKTDEAVYIDEYVSFLANTYGYAIDGGINGYFLDNEPENWSTRFPEAVSSPISPEDLVSRSAELAYAVKKIDPTALIYGPSVSGIEAFINIKNSGGWEPYRGEYSWFIDYYLDNMKRLSDEHGTRLLDSLDVHYHTEATNGLLQPILDSNDTLSNNARLQATRILWDSSYTENSTTAIMHNQYIPLIPTLKASIDMYYPGTKLSFSEYNFGGGNDISGGIAAADALGIFASYGVHMACMNPNSTDIPYLKSAINIYTNYDGNGSGFGNSLVRSNNGGDVMSSVYSAIQGKDESTLKTLIINKNQFNAKTAEISITSGVDFTGAEVYFFNEEGAAIKKGDDITDIENNRLTFDMEPRSVYLIVFNGQTEEILGEDIVTSTENTGTDISGNDTSITENEETSATTPEPEHVDAETYSSAGTKAPEEETVPALQESSAETLSGISENPETAVSSGTDSVQDDEPDEKKVPEAVKAIVSLLAAAVALALIYVFVSDIAARKKKLK